MSHFWWLLPGPARYLSRVTQDLRDGRNVLLCLPEHAPNNMRSMIKSLLGEDWDWHTVNLAEEGHREPVHLLFSRFAPATRPDAIRNANTLLVEESFAGKIIWLEGINSSNWPVWKEFLVEYGHACHMRSLFDRTLFCVPLVGKDALDTPLEDVCLAQHFWRGCVSHLDMLLFTANLFQDMQMPGFHKQLVISVAAGLALWDPTVSEWMRHEKFERIMKPFPILQEIAKQRGWNHENTIASSESWFRGMTDLHDGKVKVHSAACACCNEDRTIKLRVWSGQVGVLLPFVEEKRQEILERLNKILRVPFTTRFGDVIDNWRDLEIGHIESQIIENRIIIDADTRRLIQQLREWRNGLSHLEPIEPELMLADEIKNCL